MYSDRQMYGDRGRLTGAELTEMKQNLIIDIKSLLLGSTDGLSDRELKTDYRKLVGRDLPYIQLGYNSLYNLMADLSDICYIRTHYSGNTYIYYAVLDESTKPLANLVQNQLDPKKKVRERKRCTEYARNNNNTQQTSYISNGYNGGSSYGKSRMPFNNSYQNASKYVPNTMSGFQRITTHPKSQYVPPFIQKKITDVLNFAPGNKMSAKDFEVAYKNKNGYYFDWYELGFDSAREMLGFLTHLVIIQPIASKLNEDEYSITLIKSELNEKIVVEQKPNDKETSLKPLMKQLSLEEEVIENLKIIIKSAGSPGILCIDIMGEYVKLTGKRLELVKLGYSDLTIFINDKISKFVDFKMDHIQNGLCVISKDENKPEVSGSKEDRKSETIENKNESKGDVAIKQIKDLQPFIDTVMRFHPKPDHIPPNEFFAYFERYNGWSLEYADYGFTTRDQLILKIVELGFMELNFKRDHQHYIGCKASHQIINKNVNKNNNTDCSNHKEDLVRKLFSYYLPLFQLKILKIESKRSIS